MSSDIIRGKHFSRPQRLKCGNAYITEILHYIFHILLRLTDTVLIKRDTSAKKI